MFDFLSFRVADCDTDHYLVDAKVRKRLAVSNRAAQTFDTEGFNLKTLDKVQEKSIGLESQTGSRLWKHR
jgi:hypothetical protein